MYDLRSRAFVFRSWRQGLHPWPCTFWSNFWRPNLKCWTTVVIVFVSIPSSKITSLLFITGLRERLGHMIMTGPLCHPNKISPKSSTVMAMLYQQNNCKAKIIERGKWNVELWKSLEHHIYESIKHTTWLLNQLFKEKLKLFKNCNKYLRGNLYQIHESELQSYLEKLLLCH